MTVESKLCDQGFHYDYDGCKCSCHPRYDQPADSPTGLPPSTDMKGATWHPGQDTAA